MRPGGVPQGARDTNPKRQRGLTLASLTFRVSVGYGQAGGVSLSQVERFDPILQSPIRLGVIAGAEDGGRIVPGG
jgi:hypothetical protein